MVIHFGYLAKKVDMETAFLYRELEGELFMDCPHSIGKDDCIILNNYIYGLFQATRQTIKRSSKF